MKKLLSQKVTKFNPNSTINISTNSDDILDNIIPKHYHLFYSFKLSESFNPSLQ